MVDRERGSCVFFEMFDKKSNFATLKNGGEIGLNVRHILFVMEGNVLIQNILIKVTLEA